MHHSLMFSGVTVTQRIKLVIFSFFSVLLTARTTNQTTGFPSSRVYSDVKGSNQLSKYSEISNFTLHFGTFCSFAKL